MTDDTAARLEALEARLDQTSEALVAIGALIANALRGESAATLRGIATEAGEAAERCRAAGKPEAARLFAAFEQSLEKPWSFLEWLDKTFG